jgi:hypothetical protein
MTASQDELIQPFVMISFYGDQVTYFQQLFYTIIHVFETICDISQLDQGIFILVEGRSFQALFQGLIGAMYIPHYKGALWKSFIDGIHTIFAGAFWVKKNKLPDSSFPDGNRNEALNEIQN